jgi:cyclopropane-fatty-acyl-phospholipid synthase
MGEFHLFYSITAFFIKFYKWLELYLLRAFFSTRLERKVRSSYRKIGVQFFGSGATQKSPKEEKRERKKWDVEVHNQGFFARIANHASMGMGETYMDSWWECEDIVELSYRIFTSGIYLEYLNPWNRFLNYAELSFFNLQSSGRAWEVGKKHYDIGNDLFESFLDPHMTYSCGYWANAKNLGEAQVNKMELIAQKLKLKKGMRVLDIGCGWGGLCNYLAKNHGVECVGITISEEGVKYAKEKGKGLDVDFRLMDYRDLNEEFDRVVSVGMFEVIKIIRSLTYHFLIK